MTDEDEPAIAFVDGHRLRTRHIPTDQQLRDLSHYTIEDLWRHKRFAEKAIKLLLKLYTARREPMSADLAHEIVCLTSDWNDR